MTNWRIEQVGYKRFRVFREQNEKSSYEFDELRLAVWLLGHGCLADHVLEVLGQLDSEGKAIVTLQGKR